MAVSNTDSRVAQWKRAGPITQRSVDRNYALLKTIFFLLHPIILYRFKAVHFFCISQTSMSH